MKKIDAVITWVNESDIEWIDKYNKNKSNLITNENCMARFRSNKQIEFLIQLIRKNMIFIDKIYIVTSGEKIPEIDDERVIHIRHDEIAPCECQLPTFSSTVIETFIHKIQGMSENYLYFNDDFFPINKIDYEFYFQKNGSINLYHDLPLSKIIEINQKTATRLIRTKIWLESLFGKNDYLSLAHIPNIMNINICEKFIIDNKKYINTIIKNRFRNNYDFQVRLGISYAHHFSTHLKYNIIRVDQNHLTHWPMNPGNLKDFNTILDKEKIIDSKFLSIQDNLNNEEKEYNLYISTINKYLKTIL